MSAQIFNHPRTLRCPNCNEMINDSMTTCKFCSVAVDPGIAALVAERQEKANEACSDASYLRSAAAGMFVFLAVGLFLTIGYVGFVITFIATILMLVRWQLKFGDLLTNDPDYDQAKRSRNITTVLLVVAVPVGIVASPFFDVIVQQVKELASLVW
jgi:hypothetical protein